MSKGSNQRRMIVDQKTFDRNWNNIFGDKKMLTETKKSCPCGRSPTDRCVGWHNLTEEQYRKVKEEHNKKRPK